MRSSKMSGKSAKSNFHFSNWFYTPFAKYLILEGPLKIGQLVPIQAVEGLQRHWETKKLSALFGCIFQSVFARSDSFCLITSHMNTDHICFCNCFMLAFHCVVLPHCNNCTEIWSQFCKYPSCMGWYWKIQQNVPWLYLVHTTVPN